MTTHTYTLGRVIPASGTGYSRLPALFNESWLSDVFKDIDKAFDIPNATYPYNIVADIDPEGNPVAYYIEVALAGVGRDNIKVHVKEGHLFISVEKEDAEPDEHIVYHRKAVSYTHLTLPTKRIV